MLIQKGRKNKQNSRINKNNEKEKRKAKNLMKEEEKEKRTKNKQTTRLQHAADRTVNAARGCNTVLLPDLFHRRRRDRSSKSVKRSEHQKHRTREMHKEEFKSCVSAAMLLQPYCEPLSWEDFSHARDLDCANSWCVCCDERGSASRRTPLTTLCSRDSHGCRQRL